jgi:carboxypeptidase D
MKYSALVSLALGAATMAHATPVDTVQADANRPLNVIDTVRAMVQKSIAKNGPRPVKQVAPDAQADALLPPLPILSGNNTSKGCSPNCNSTLKFSTAQAKAMEIGNNIPGIPFPVRNSWGGNIPIGTDKNTTLYSWLWGAEQKSDDLVIWLQGGPGCSSLSGMLQEVGPFQYFDVGDTPYVNPYSWTNAANILFVESPLGTGYSTGVPTAKDENDVAAQFASFLDNYYKVFPELKSNKLWIVGESYGGAYVPYISNYQYKIGNPHNLQGVGIIDGTFTNRPIQTDVVTYSYAKRHQKEIGLTDGDIAQIKAVSDQCGYTGFEDRYLKYPPTEKFATPSCAQSAQNTFFDLAMQRNPCFNVYHGESRDMFFEVSNTENFALSQ